METAKKPENLMVARRRGMTVLGGFLWIAGAAAFEAVMVFACFSPYDTPAEMDGIVLGCLIGVSFFALVMLINSALCFNNLRFPFVLTVDEKGITDFSGFIHCGFIPWDDIQSISCATSVEAALDLLNSNSPALRLQLKNAKRTFAGKSALFNVMRILAYTGQVKICTLCSTVERRKLAVLLQERLIYFRQQIKEQ